MYWNFVWGLEEYLALRVSYGVRSITTIDSTWIIRSIWRELSSISLGLRNRRREMAMVEVVGELFD